MKKKFEAREGAPFPAKDAQLIGEELDYIKKVEHTLTPEIVVERARNEKSVLNKYFEWDNSSAGEKWRLQQARMITNHIIEVVVVRGEEVKVRGFVNVIGKSGGNIYVSHAEAIENKDYRKQLISQMQATLENLLKLIKIFSSL